MGRPTKAQLVNWTEGKKYEALRAFREVKRAEVYASLLGTEFENECIEWDEALKSLNRLLDNLHNLVGWRQSQRYSIGEYKEKYINAKVRELFKDEEAALENEFEKILRTIRLSNSPKQIMEYLKACELEYPVDDEKEVPVVPPIDVSIYKPWLQKQLASGEADE